MADVEPITTPLGLITQPNKLGQYPAGALALADNVVMRSPGLLTNVPLLNSYNASPFIIVSASMTPYLLAALDTQFMHVSRNNTNGHWEVTFYTGAGKFGNDVNGVVPPQTFDNIGGRIFYTQQRGRTLLNADTGIIIIDNASPASNAQALPRVAGIGAPVIFVSNITTGNPGVFAANNQAAYRAIVRRVASDGYELVSAPSPAIASGSNVVSDGQIAVYWNFNATAQFGYAVGDIIEFYRTPQQADGVNLGSTYYLSTKHVITTAELAAGTVTVVDKTPESALQSGAELYTNPGQTGENSSKLVPPLARCMATYKGYTFWGNITEPAQIALTVPGGFLLNFPAGNAYIRATGIGNRVFTATFTNTSNVLTVISAADIVGLAIGQYVSSAHLVGTTGQITAVGATTITLTVAANANIVDNATAVDVLQVNGVDAPTSWWGVGPSFYLRGTGVMVQAAAVFPPAVISGSPLQDTYSAVGFTVSQMRAAQGNIAIRATNGQSYVPPLPAYNATVQTLTPTIVANGIAWSEQGQPEVSPILNRLPVGSGTLYWMGATRDGLWIFASDGLWRLVGTGGGAGRGFDWALSHVDSTLSLSGPHAACVLKDTVYAYTNRGLVAISPSGVDDSLSQHTVNDLLPGPPWSATTAYQMTANETDDEIWLGVITAGAMTYYIYNTQQNCWTRSFGGAGGTTDRVVAYSRFAQTMGSLDGTTAYLADGASYGTPVVDYQPLTAGDPFAIKQWIDATYVGSFDNAGRIVQPRFNGTAYTGRQLVAQSAQDARASWAVPRNAPAVANSLAPGFTSGSSTQLKFYGFALRSNTLTNQRKQR